MKNLLERSGYSYSGISDIIRNQGKAEELLIQIDNKYNDVCEKQKELEADLEILKQTRGKLVSCFLHCHKILEKTSGQKLAFINGDFCIIISYKSENVIDYERVELTEINKEKEE